MDLDGSDLHIKTDSGKVFVRVHGDLQDVDDVPHFNERDFMLAMRSLLRDQQIKKFEESMELDFALEVPGVSRFRGNMFRQRGTPQAIFRVIPFDIVEMEELGLPDLCYDLVDRPRGLVLVTGPAGSGKSTTLASMIDAVNRSMAVHIVTVEDPVEFVHSDHVALINQRELDVDTLSFANALKYVLRQDPDVILVGEMRDLETIHLAITAAETGHLVFGTLHTVDALQTVDRIVDVFPQHQQQQIRMQLSVNLLGVISQTLVPRKDRRGRVAAFEVLNCTPAVRNLIRENKTYQISSIIQTGAKQKMHTLDQGLARLVERGLVDLEVAKSRAKDPGEFMRIVSLASRGREIQASRPVAEHKHIQFHEPEVIHATDDQPAQAEQAAADQANDAALMEGASGVEPQLAEAVVPTTPGAPEEVVHDPAAYPVVEPVFFDVGIPTQDPMSQGGNASHRVVPESIYAPQPPAAQPQARPIQPEQVKPAARQASPFDPLSEGRPAKIDPVTKQPAKQKKKGFFAALFGDGRD